MDFFKKIQINFPNAATVVMYGIVSLHHYIMNLLIVVLVLKIFQVILNFFCDVKKGKIFWFFNIILNMLLFYEFK